MLIESNGIYLEKYFVPSFNLDNGETVIINLFGGAHFQPTANYLKDIFTGRISQAMVKIYTPMKFIELIDQSKWWNLNSPSTVGDYLKKYAGRQNPYSTKIYETYPWMNERTKLNSLAGTHKKLLSLFASLCISPHIILDLIGIDPVGAEVVYAFVQANVEKGGSAIVLDWTADFKNKCTSFVELRRLDNLFDKDVAE